MADCSKTIDFLKERKRLCDSYLCEKCLVLPFFEIPDIPVDCPLFDDDLCDEKLIDFLQQWSDEHPAPKPKTYAEVFFEQHPKATRLENGRPRAYRCEVYGCECKYKCPPDVIDSTFNTDRDPCKICWDEPYPEQEVSNE